MFKSLIADKSTLFTLLLRGRPLNDPDSKVYGANMGLPGTDRTQVDPMLAHEFCYLCETVLNNIYDVTWSHINQLIEFPTNGEMVCRQHKPDVGCYITKNIVERYQTRPEFIYRIRMIYFQIQLMHRGPMVPSGWKKTLMRCSCNNSL